MRRSAINAALGQRIYESNCAACHNIAVMGGPKIGDKENWATRTRNGLDPVIKNAIHVVGRMPTKGSKMNPGGCLTWRIVARN